MTDKVEVRQVDRDATARYLGGMPNMRESNESELVQAFARHRATAEASARKAVVAEAAGVAEEYANAVPTEELSGQIGGPFLEVCKLLADSIASAIRALAEKDG